MKLIGITGRAGAGKDTVADYLVENYDFVKRGFADPLYEEVSAAFTSGRSAAEPYLRKRETKETDVPFLALGNCHDGAFIICAVKKLDAECAAAGIDRYKYPTTVPLSPRWILQTWGTEYRRGQDPNYWVNKMEVFVNQFLRELEPNESCGGIVVPDTRFVNEAAWIRSRTGEVWHLHRPAAPSIPLSDHVSEEIIQPEIFDKTILNRNGIAELHTAVSLVLQGAQHIAT